MSMKFNNYQNLSKPFMYWISDVSSFIDVFDWTCVLSVITHNHFLIVRYMWFYLLWLRAHSGTINSEKKKKRMKPDDSYAASWEVKRKCAKYWHKMHDKPIHLFHSDTVEFTNRLYIKSLGYTFLKWRSYIVLYFFFA